MSAPDLAQAARSAYRALARTAGRTFRGDDPVRRAFLMKARNEYIPSPTLAPDVFAERLAFAREIETVLRTNIVQAVKAEDRDVYRLRVTEDTELGDNDTVKQPLTKEQRRAGRVQCCGGGSSSSQSTLPNKRPFSTSRSLCSSKKASSRTPKLTESELALLSNTDASAAQVNLSMLKKLAAARAVPTLNEDDLDEAFVRGSGPGGQSINKTRNCVQLTHRPTGLRVDCQMTRSLADNRRIARIWLLRKLDEQVNPGLSKASVMAARKKERKRQKMKKKRKAERERAKAGGGAGVEVDEDEEDEDDDEDEDTEETHEDLAEAPVTRSKE
ncbi:hypothetical protein AURDEDRAFT_157434 [Auricularia subglabra TFB-10046 SS5]|nr:hypothetical protein AURDEDRAFT_157434 [Auricularia subglabra TFB-10046 SS5]